MKIRAKIITLLGAAALVASVSGAGILQATRGGGELYAVKGRDSLRIGRLGGVEEEIRVPPGTAIHDLEPAGSGWLAAGQVATANGSQVLLLEAAEGSIRSLPAPQVSGAKLGNQPILLIQDDSLVGLVWAAGSDFRGLEIWAADWLHGQWSEPELIAAKGPGSQLSPRSVVLEDGSWLVVWAAFDGEDDEILWSRRVRGEWSKPARVTEDNAVPDITPSLATIDGGAMLAWSWYDGNDYRLKLTRYLDGGWSVAKSFGEKGSLYPSMVRGEEGVSLLYKTVAPASWTVLGFDRQGVAKHRAVVPVDVEERPLIAIDSASGILLRWQGTDSSFELESDRAGAWQELP